MAARAAARAEDRIERSRQPLLPNRPGHIGHHLHRLPSGTACSCGTDFQEACYVDEGEDESWWNSQECTLCERVGVVHEGQRSAI
jgi:hypothetical protein